jgi:predicted nucleotidyltransferase
MRLDKISELLYAEAVRISKAAPGTTWYMFGSFLRCPSTASDIDILVKCESDETAVLVRQEVADLCITAPIHLLLLTSEEESETGFIRAEGCMQFYPTVPLHDPLLRREA